MHGDSPLVNKMGWDNRGVERGGCSVSGCSCGEFKALPSRYVCGTCRHPPAKHASVAQPAPPPYSSTAQGGSLSMTHPYLILHQQTHSYNCFFFYPSPGWRGREYSTGDVSQSHSQGSVQHGHHVRQLTDICPQCRQPCTVLLNGSRCERCTAGSRVCKREGCSSPRFFDPELGKFKYCSPQCRNEDYLPRHARELKDSLEQSKGKCTVDTSSGSASSPTLGRSNSHGNIATLTPPTSLHPYIYQSHCIYSSQTHRRRQS